MDEFKRFFDECLSAETFNSVEGNSIFEDFRAEICKPSLNVKVQSAVTYRRQGHFDKAMSQISEVNRDQITSIRSIQSILAKITGEPYSEAVFEKFRQFEPFELGVSKADPVLILLSKLDHNTNPDFRNLRSRLRETELQHEDQTQYLSFLKRKYGEETHGAEIEETTINIGLSDDALLKLRLSIIERVISVIDEIVKKPPLRIG